jgi:hypothetical protein
MLIDRRTFVGGTSAILLPGRALAWSRRDIFNEALIATFPLYETARLAMASPTGFNRIGHRRLLSDHSSRGVTMPNNDTLYSACWLDLTNGPVELTVPSTAGRYLSVALMDAFTDNIAVLRAPVNSQAIKVKIAGPGWKGNAPKGVRLVRMQSAYGWLLGRTFVEGADDIVAARVVQDGIVVQSAAPTPSRLNLLAKTTTQPDGSTYLAAVNAAIASLDPKHPLVPTLRRYASLGIGGTAIDNWQRLDADFQAGWTNALAKLGNGTLAEMGDHASVRNGWSWPDAHIGKFGKDARFRAAVALSGIGALPQKEATYLRAVADNMERPIDPHRRYRLTLPPTQQICDAFWSLSAYRGEADGRYFFEDNIIHRYAINSATNGLKRDANGAIELIIQVDRPATDVSNWLPLPSTNPALVLRIYRPARGLMRSPRLIGPPHII